MSVPTVSRELVALGQARLALPDGSRALIAVPEGTSLAEVVSGVPEGSRGALRVFVNGALALDWSYRPRASDNVLLAVVPAGSGGSGKGILGAVLMIGLMFFAPWAAGLMAASGTFAYAAATVAITMVGMMAINALVRPPALSTAALGGPAQTYSLTGQSNSPRQYDSCYVCYGQHKVLPAMATNPDLDNMGATSVLSALYDFGLGNLAVENICIGDVPIEQYAPEMYVYANSYCDNLRLIPERIGYDQYALVMVQGAPITLRTKTDSYAANLDITFARGIYQAEPKFGYTDFTADFQAWWRPAAGGAWTMVPLDWYNGTTRYYVEPPIGLQVSLSDPASGALVMPWTPYDPATTPAAMAQAKASVQANANPSELKWFGYTNAKPNTQLEWLYPSGAPDENYFYMYPDILAAGWTRSAQEHFEQVGSREGRALNLWVAYWRRPPGGGAYTQYAPSIATQLHAWDKQDFPSDPLVGAWGWIDRGGQPIAASALAPVFDWQSESGYAFPEAVYLARYPDVAYMVGVGTYPSGWAHFSQTGALEGRDPYTAAIAPVVRMQAAYPGAYTARITFVFPTPGQYDLQVERIDKIEDGTDTTIAITSGGSITSRVNETTLTLLRSYEYGLPVQPRLRHTMLELRVQATDKLSGVINNLSAVVTSILPTTVDGVNFVAQATRNPAWIALDILTSERNPKPLDYSQVDWPSWLDLAADCDALRSYTINGLPYTSPRYVCDTVVDAFTTVKALVDSVLAVCRAALVLTTAGKWGVLQDKEKTVPRQLITPANSWGFSGALTYTVLPHALRVTFVNRNNGWVNDEVVVYADGYDATNATQFETLDTFGITDYAQAWAFGRYMLAQGIFRSELFTLSMDVENLLVQRGDLVYVAHDVPLVGGVPSRVDRVGWTVGPNGGGLLHCNLPLAVAPSGYCVRRSDGSLMSGRIVSTPDADGTFEVDNLTGVEVDDLIVVGDYAQTTEPYLVQSIAPGADLSASLTLCRYVPAIYEADQGAIPPWTPDIGRDFVNAPTDLAVTGLTATQTLYYVTRDPFVDAVLAWQTSGYGLDHHEVAVALQDGRRIVLDSTVGPQNFRWTLDALRDRQYFGNVITFEVKPVSTLGKVGRSAFVSITLALDTTPPPPVAFFGANVQSETIDLFWTEPDAPDLAGYLLRYTPEVNFPSWEAAQQLASIASPTTKTSAGARTGSYGIRAVDTSGNISAVVWRRTTVAVLPDINVITILDDANLAPLAWAGTLDHMERHGTTITTAGDFGAIYPDGSYLFAETVDLGQVYESRVSSKIQATATIAGDLLANWPTLAALDAMSHTLVDWWDAWLEVRGANAMAMLSDWATLTSVNPMAGANDSQWSPWTAITVGDVTAQVLQFRIRVSSSNPGVRVIVSSGEVDIDMPDRVDTYGNIAVPAAGLDFVFPVAFRALQAVAITIDGNANPVVATVTNKTPQGLHIVLTNTQNAQPVAGQVDIMAEGSGRERLTSI